MAADRGGSGPPDPPLDDELPPGQHRATSLPQLWSGPAPTVATKQWEFVLSTEDGPLRRWDWIAFRAMPSTHIEVDLHSVTGWSLLGSHWEATSMHQLLAGVQTSAQHVVVQSFGDYTTNLPLEDLLEMPTWLAFAYEGHELAVEDGGPVRLLVPHLYLWKSVPWVRGMTLTVDDHPGTRERLGYHNYGDPWRQQRFQGD